MIRIMADKNEITFIKFLKEFFGEFFLATIPYRMPDQLSRSVANFKFINDNFVFF